MRKVFYRGAVLLWLVLAWQVVQAQPRAMDKIVAIVDAGVVLESELEERLVQIRQQLQERGGPPMSNAQLRKEVLDQLILENLQLQMAERAGVRVDDNTLNQAMADIAAQNGMNFEQFRDILEREGIYRQTRADIARELTINQLQQRAVNGRIDITRQEIENYLRSEAGQSDIAPEYRAAHLLIPAGGSFDERRQELASLLYKQLRDGADILAIAQAGQIAGIPVEGGDLGWRKPETLPSLFTEVVPTLAPGEVAEPFSSSSGHHLVQLLETRGGTELSVEQTHLRHILIQPNQIRTEEQARDLAQQLYERIQNGEDFAAIARQHTNDPSSMVSGGDLDWLSPGQLPPDVEAKAGTMEVGEMSEPFRAETGWHIIEVLGRRDRDLTNENRRYRAQQVLRNRKFEMELQNWLTELRDSAFIDIKDETLASN